MSLEHAVLGFLQYGPSSGYDLKSLFDLSVQHFWPADQSQLYRTLARLADRGWATMTVVEQEDRPDRKVYHITPTGGEELARWLATPVAGRGGRSAALVQVFFAGQLPDEDILAMFRRAADRMRAEHEHLHKLPAQCGVFEKLAASPREMYCWMLTLECGIRQSEAHLAWLESVIARIEAGELPPPDAIQQPVNVPAPCPRNAAPDTPNA
jgi:PadR family transcriptional regulator, regulatory protein AphA